MPSKPTNRVVWIAAVAVLGLGAMLALAGSPTLVALWTAAAAAVLPSDPTAQPAPESAPVQCAAQCNRAMNEQLGACLGALSPTERTQRGLPAPTKNCYATLQESYSACVVTCGLPAPAAPLVLAQPPRFPQLPPVGTPEALRATGPR